ncbi:Rec8 like protein-domain-containing protein [Cytidiella melzeri]|nr:Rec8 like protein-domain-containing protein [Cytidiella melzeri]
MGGWTRRPLRESCDIFKLKDLPQVPRVSLPFLSSPSLCSPVLSPSAMFFSPELLSRRDSGFGLLWLAATLGAKSSFSKLPKRSVMTANISQLCGLIAEPQEPLALRLSSNLMIGVARVYKVKQEILLTDVTTCFHTLKRAFQDAHLANSAADQLQMAQPSVRPDTVTISANPAAAFAMDFDNLFGNWDERTRGDEDDEGDGSDDDFGVKKKGKKKAKTKSSSISQAEQPRADLHTLQEHNNFMISSSFDASFVAGGLVPSSSQVGGYGFDDNFLDGLDIGADIGAELAKELGDGWGMILDNPASDDHGGITALGVDMGSPMDMNADFQLGEDMVGMTEAGHDTEVRTSPGTKRRLAEVDNDFLQPDGSIIVPLSPFGTATQVNVGEAPAAKKPRRVRLLLDARTELTNEELERARENYLQGQAGLRNELAQKKAEKEGMKMLEEMVWGAPRGINAPALVQFWEENFKLQVEAISGQSTIDGYGSRKRRKVVEEDPVAALATEGDWNRGAFDDGMNIDINFEVDAGIANDIGQEDLDLVSRLRSSEVQTGHGC